MWKLRVSVAAAAGGVEFKLLHIQFYLQRHQIHSMRKKVQIHKSVFSLL